MNKEILRLAIPSIFANMTVPLVGMVDTALAGHLGTHSASYIGAISVGSMFFSLLYWSFSFLRTGTSGLTAQA
ncbi:MAG: MATE family efflux transporter, partial [Bacteroidales bacterium]|nr:MATE family efflux transporter [Bacteroidales bacterium]